MGLIAPKAIRDGSRKPIAEHLADYVAHLRSLSRSRKHLAYTKNRILRLCGACGWKRLQDVSSGGFNRWAATETALGPKTRNEYLAHISGFMTWLEKNGLIARNPLKTVSKAETRGQERVKRRALDDAEIAKLIELPGGRGLVYFTACFTGLRREEIKALLWADLHLDEAKPFVSARACTTKNKKAAHLPLVPELARRLRELRAKQGASTGKVFRPGVPKPKRMRKDLAACEIPYMDELGRRVDFHSLRHTFDSLLHRWGVSPRVIMELMRHSDMRLSNSTYLDASLLPTFTEMEKLPSPGASPKPDKNGQNLAKVVQSGIEPTNGKVVAFRGETVPLAKAVPSWETAKMAEREGFEPPVPCGTPDFESGAFDHSATSP